MTGKRGQIIVVFLLLFVACAFGYAVHTVEMLVGGEPVVSPQRVTYQRLVFIFSVITGLFLMLTVMLVVLFIKNTFTTEKYKNQMITLSAIYRSMPDMVFAKDINGLYTSCNHSFLEFAGRSTESDIIGRSPLEVFTINEKMALRFMEMDKRVLAEKVPVKVEEYFTFPDSSHRLFETIKAPLIRDGELIGMLGISRDITQHKAAEDAAHEASRAKSNFLAKMSHEIRTPMNAVIGMAELALREKDMSAVRRHIFTVKQAGTNLLSIINDILDFTKIESGKFEIIPNYYQFSSLINDVISIIRMRAIDSHLRFAVYIDNSIPNELYGDETRIRQVLINVLGNAIKYTDEGFVTFTVKGQMLDEDTVNLIIDIMDSGRGIKKEHLDELFTDFAQFDTAKNRNIEGTGLGLAITWNILKAAGGDIKAFSEYGQGSIFTITLPQKFRSCEKLAHVESPEKKNVLIFEHRDIYAASIVATLDNLGVNSTLVSEYTEFHDKLTKKTYPFIFVAHALYRQHKAMILGFEKSSKIVLITEFGEATSNDGRSILAMPAHCISVATIMNGQAEAYSYKENDHSHTHFIASDTTVLVVDDIKTNLIIAEGLLLPYNMQIDLCKSGAEAIAAVQSRHYDLVFMDHWMPEMDGVEATRRIRALGGENSYYRLLPIIALTANVISGTQDMFIENGLNGFLAKPIDTVKLNIILERWIPREKRKSFLPGDNKRFGKTAEELDASSMAALEIKGVDAGKGLVLTGGSVERYLETLTVFCADGYEKMEQLRTCLETDNIPLYTILVHALKSASANIGAEALSNAARDLEKAGKQADLDFINTHHHQLLAALSSLLGNIQDVVSAHMEKSGVSPDAEVLKTKLAELKQALETLDAHAMNTIVDALLNLKPCGEAVQSISRNILMSDFDQALALTESLLEELK